MGAYERKQAYLGGYICERIQKDGGCMLYCVCK